MELLKRFEEDSMEDDKMFEEEEDDEDELVNRLNGIDLGASVLLPDGRWFTSLTYADCHLSIVESASYEQLMSVLTQTERDKFMKALGDPSSELAQQLLASEVLERERIEPWWEANLVSLEDEDENSSKPIKKYSEKRFGKLPAMMIIPQSMISSPTPSSQGPPLLYNLCAMW